MTTINALGWFWAAAAALSSLTVAYVLLACRLAQVVQPFRLELAKRCASLLRSDLAKSDKDVVRFMMLNAFSIWPATIIAIILPIILTWQSIIEMSTNKKFGPPNAECGLAARLFLYSTLAANPFAGAIVVLELLTFGLLGFLVGGHVLVLRAVFMSQRLEAMSGFAKEHHGAMA